MWDVEIFSSSSHIIPVCTFLYFTFILYGFRIGYLPCHMLGGLIVKNYPSELKGNYLLV